jgi:hypothetical protein
MRSACVIAKRKAKLRVISTDDDEFVRSVEPTSRRCRRSSAKRLGELIGLARAELFARSHTVSRSDPAVNTRVFSGIGGTFSMFTTLVVGHLQSKAVDAAPEPRSGS